jgi:hypothetical protein
MKKKILKSVAVAGFCAGCYLLCRVLQVPPLYLSLLSGWGGFCFLFSYELAGSGRPDLYPVRGGDAVPVVLSPGPRRRIQEPISRNRL